MTITETSSFHLLRGVCTWSLFLLWRGRRQTRDVDCLLSKGGLLHVHIGRHLDQNNVLLEEIRFGTLQSIVDFEDQWWISAATKGKYTSWDTKTCSAPPQECISWIQCRIAIPIKDSVFYCSHFWQFTMRTKDPVLRSNMPTLDHFESPTS